ncbi:phosphotransferase [Candidatus Gottesmanbacteria bacterium]|nr:phosphotransferase [Candidatus Gottesmanbacteria bacterium]
MKIIDLSNRMNMFYWQTNRQLSAKETKEIFMNRYGQIDNATIRRIVEYGMANAGFTGKDIEVKHLKSTIKQGSVNTVIPVELESGQIIVLRIHPKRVKNGYFWVEKIATSLAKKEGVPTYSTIFIDDTQAKFPFDFMIMSCVSGRPMQELNPLNPKLEKKLVTDTGKYTALIHKIQTVDFGFYDNKKAKDDQMLLGQYKFFKEHIYAGFYEDLKFLVENQILTRNQRKTVETIFSKNEDLINIKRGFLIHNDIADWNELSDGKSITGIMDWDECFSGDPLMELSAYSLFFGEPRITWFKQGYNQVGTLENNEDKFQLFKLRYLISKMHLRKKRSLIDNSPIIRRNIQRGMEAMREVFKFFKL